MSNDSERLDRLEAIVAKALNIDFSEFDTPSQAHARAKELKQAQEINQQQQAVEQRQAGVTAAEDRIAAEEAAGRKDAPAHQAVPELTAGPRHLVTDGTTGGPQPSDTGKPKMPDDSKTGTARRSRRKTGAGRSSSKASAAKSSSTDKSSAATDTDKSSSAASWGTGTQNQTSTASNTAKDKA